MMPGRRRRLTDRGCLGAAFRVGGKRLGEEAMELGPVLGVQRRQDLILDALERTLDQG